MLLHVWEYKITKDIRVQILKAQNAIYFWAPGLKEKKKKQICFYDMHYFLNKIQEIRQSYVPKIQVVTPESQC